MQTYERHYLSRGRELQGDEFEQLKASIEKIGVQEPVRLYGGQIIDGWNRYRACTELGVDCPAFDLEPEVDPRDFAASTHMRRNLSASERAILIVEIYDWVPLGANQHKKEGGSNESPSLTNIELASKSGTSLSTINRAKKALSAAPDVVEAVKAGKISAARAADVVSLPATDQLAAAKAVKKTEPEDAPEYDPNDDLRDAIHNLKDENEHLTKLLALEAVPEDDRIEMNDYIDSLNKQIKDLTVERDALKSSRDTYMVENGELKKQCQYLQRQLKKVA
jgi:ParB-like chromosome segregation protein Spo0J